MWKRICSQAQQTDGKGAEGEETGCAASDRPKMWVNGSEGGKGKAGAEKGFSFSRTTAFLLFPSPASCGTGREEVQCEGISERMLTR